MTLKSTRFWAEQTKQLGNVECGECVSLDIACGLLRHHPFLIVTLLDTILFRNYSWNLFYFHSQTVYIYVLFKLIISTWNTICFRTLGGSFILPVLSKNQYDPYSAPIVFEVLYDENMYTGYVQGSAVTVRFGVYIESMSNFQTSTMVNLNIFLAILRKKV